MNSQPIEILRCFCCGQAHAIYDYDEAGDFPCGCGQWLNWQPSRVEPEDFEPEVHDVSREIKGDER